MKNVKILKIDVLMIDLKQLQNGNKSIANPALNGLACIQAHVFMIRVLYDIYINTYANRPS